MHIIIIGVNHQIQPAEILSGSSNGKVQAFEREQKEAFGSFVYAKIEQRGVQFIGEEARHGQETVVERLCARDNRRYANIEMTLEERTARDIPPGYDEDQNLPEAERVRCNREREAYMVERVLEQATDVESTLVICGRNHVVPLAERFHALGHSVDTTDLQGEGWYVEDWTQRMMNL